MITLADYAESQTILRDEMIAGFRLQMAAAVEELLSRFVATGHADHVNRITRVFDSTTAAGMRDKYVCQKDTATLVLVHEMKMTGGKLTWTVTPEVTLPVSSEDRETAVALDATDDDFEAAHV